MEYSDDENEINDDEMGEVYGPEDLFNDEADEEENDEKSDTEKPPDEIKIKNEDTKEKKEKKQRVVKNPRVLLNFDTLKGNNGLSALKNLVTDFKFKGEGHEKEDLVKIMSVLQQWMCYQLCPSYDFESCMLQLENLGKKKIVQTLMAKYRLGMNDWGEKTDDVDKKSDVDADDDDDQGMGICGIAEDDFDILLDQDGGSDNNDNDVPQATPVVQSQSQAEVTLTPEQLERINRNRKLAEERKLKRMSSQTQPMEISQPSQELPEQETNVDQITSVENN